MGRTGTTHPKCRAPLALSIPAWLAYLPSVTQHFDIAVIGAGLSGLLAASALGQGEPGAGRRVALIDAGEIARPRPDTRATALAPSSMRLLRRLGVQVEPAEPMVGMRVGEGDADTPWQFELPSRPGEPLAHVVPNAALRTALIAALPDTVQRFEGVTLSDFRADGAAALDLSDGTSLGASLVVACDGRDSAVRRLTGISVSRTDFAQSALVATVHHAEPHDGIALQRFAEIGAVASLPLPEEDGVHRSQIVWSDRSRAVEAAAALPSNALAALIDERLWSYLDVSAVEPGVQSYPLIGQRAASLTGERVVLIGDAARVIHPLAGQGWNLAVRDVAALHEGVTAAIATGQDIGTAGLLDYARWRRADETLLATLTTALSRGSLPGALRISRFGGLPGHARRVAFAITDSVPALHPFIRREAAAEGGKNPSLMA